MNASIASSYVEREPAVCAFVVAFATFPLACGTDFRACDGEACTTTSAGGTSGTSSMGGNVSGGSGGGVSNGGTGTSTVGGASGTGGSTSDGGAAGDPGVGGSAGGGGDAGAGGAAPLPCEGACGGETPVCDEVADSCVECLDASSDCDEATPYCSEGHECVECLENVACPAATESKCDDGTCSPCQTNDDCTHVEGKGVCDAGECVECTGTDYASCGTDDELTPLVCDSLARTCSTQTASSAGLCASCVSDVACDTGMLCVRERFLPNGTDLGYVCAWHRGAEGAPSMCSAEQPYVQARVGVVSVDGAEGDVCALRVSTCAAYADFSNTNCETATPDVLDDELCGEAGLDDGICELSEGGGDNAYRCSVPCSGNDDCRKNHECDTSASSPRCKLQVGN